MSTWKLKRFVKHAKVFTWKINNNTLDGSQVHILNLELSVCKHEPLNTIHARNDLVSSLSIYTQGFGSVSHVQTQENNLDKLMNCYDCLEFKYSRSRFIIIIVLDVVMWLFWDVRRLLRLHYVSSLHYMIIIAYW